MRKGILVGAGLAALVFFTLAAYDYTEYNSREAMNVMVKGGGPDRNWSATIVSGDSDLDQKFYTGHANGLGRYSVYASGDTTRFYFHVAGGSWTTTRASGSVTVLDGVAATWEQGVLADSIRVVRPSATVEVLMIGAGWD